MDNPEKLAEMLRQQQAMKFMQSMQGGANGQQGAMGEAERMQYGDMLQMPQPGGTPMQSDMPMVSPQGTMPTNPQMGRRGMLLGAINSLDQQQAGQGAMSNNMGMMRKK